VFERLNRLSEADLGYLLKLAGDGKLFTSLAADFGISSGGWILLCNQSYEFKMLDFELYIMAIEPQIQKWADDVTAARKELSAITERGQ
jgi:hypothetical protein